jgi:hypothetical protein
VVDGYERLRTGVQRFDSPPSPPTRPGLTWPQLLFAWLSDPYLTPILHTHPRPAPGLCGWQRRRQPGSALLDGACALALVDAGLGILPHRQPVAPLEDRTPSRRLRLWVERDQGEMTGAALAHVSALCFWLPLSHFSFTSRRSQEYSTLPGEDNEHRMQRESFCSFLQEAVSGRLVSSGTEDSPLDDLLLSG